VHERRGHPHGVEHRGAVVRAQRSTLLLACTLAITLASAPGAHASTFFSRLPAAMTEPRSGAVAAALPDGDVLLAGGDNESGVLQTAEVFDPLTATFQALAGRPTRGRAFSAAAVLPAGQGVLIAGGTSGSVGLKTAEIFNPASEAFEALAGETSAERYLAAAATLPDGKVLIAGGTTGYVELKSAELFDPATKTFEALAGEMTEARAAPAIDTLPDGEVLIAGGNGRGLGRTAELFNPATDTFARLSAEMVIERNAPVATPLPDGSVLIVGGETGGTGRTTELFNPVTETFETLAAETVEARNQPVAATLPDGSVFIAGGYTNSGSAARSAEETSDLAPAAQIPDAGFGDVTVGASSALQTVVVSGVGASSLYITGASLGGAQAAAFDIEQDACTGTELEFRQICTIGVSFTPTAAGPFAATLTLADNEPSPSTVTLSGTGVPANSATGPTGANGPQGAAAVAGATGPAGPRGATGAKGAVQIVTCYTITTSLRLSGHKTDANHRVCSTVPAPAATLAGSAGAARAQLERGHRVYALGTGILSAHGRLELLLSDTRTLQPGGYTLILLRHRGARWVTTRLQVTIG
jgi:hypothetical protein